MIKKISGARDAFVLHTDNTSYIIQIAESGHPLHLYYGSRIEIAGEDEGREREREQGCCPDPGDAFEIGSSIAYGQRIDEPMLEDLCP